MNELIFRDANNQFTKILPIEEAAEGLRGVLQAVDDVFPEDDFTLVEPGAHLSIEFTVTMPVIVKEDETLHLDLLGQ